MNKKRRAQIDAIIAKLEELKGNIEDICSDEQDYLDNMPDSFSDGEKGDAARQAVENLEAAVTELDNVLPYLEEAKE